MRRDEVVKLLRQLEWMRMQVAGMEMALENLEESERDIIGTFYVRPEKRRVEKMCEKWGIERTSVYRRRDKAIKKLGNILAE